MKFNVLKVHLMFLSLSALSLQSNLMLLVIVLFVEKIRLSMHDYFPLKNMINSTLAHVQVSSYVNASVFRFIPSLITHTILIPHI